MLANVRFDAVAKSGCFLDASAGGRAHVQLELAAINAREKILPEQWQEREGKHASRQKADSEEDAVANAALEQAVVAIAQPVEAILEPLLHVHERI